MEFKNKFEKKEKIAEKIKLFSELKTGYKYIEKSIEKIDARSLASGDEIFTDDVDIDCYHAVFVRSPYPFAKVLNIENYKEIKDMEGVKEIFWYKNTPDTLYTSAGQGYPEPSPYDCRMFSEYVRYVGEPVALVVADTRENAEIASSKLIIKYEEKKPLFDFVNAEKSDIIVHDNDGAFAKIPVKYEPEKNLAAFVKVEAGDFEKFYNQSELKLSRIYGNHIAQHCAIEPHAAIAYFDQRGRLTIISTTQVPFHARRITSAVTGIDASKIRVIKPRIGGGFGSKQEVILEPYVAYASWVLKYPVKIRLSRAEVFIGTRTRHQYQIIMEAGYDKSGKIDALSMTAIENAGAYGPHSLTVLTNVGSKTLPILNKIPNVRFTGKSLYSNVVVGGAYRGYGATQGQFALNCFIDEIVTDLGIDPLDYFMKWAIDKNESSPIFKALGEGTEGVEQIVKANNLKKCLSKGAELFEWKAKREEYKSDKKTAKRYKRGVGIAVLMQGSAIPMVDMASCYLKMQDDGSAILMTGATDIGTGADTIFAQIVAETLDIPVDKIHVIAADTDVTPFDTGAYASSTTYLSGNAVLSASIKVKEQLLEVASKILNEKKENIKLEDGYAIAGKNKVCYADIVRYSMYQHNQFQIQATSSEFCKLSPPPFATHFVEIEVDTLTGKIKVLNYLAAIDCGTPINIALTEGQCEGAIVNGLSYALTEKYYLSNGRMLNPSFNRYKIFNVADIPPIKVILIPSYEETGPYGAKSVSEININGPIPSIANAFAYATGIRLYTSPFTPDIISVLLKNNL